MFPVSDDKPATRFPIVVIFIAVINAYVFWREIHLAPDRLEAMIGTFALIPSRDFAPGLRYMSFFTSMFLHGGLVHLLVNLWSFWIFGDNIEGELGHVRFFIFYLLSGFGAGLVHVIADPTSTVPVVGASGAISGVMGAYMVLFPRAKIRMFTLLIFYPLFFEIPALVFLAIWLLGQVVSGAAVVGAGSADSGGIAFMAHVGGFLSGIVLLPLFRRGRRRRVA